MNDRRQPGIAVRGIGAAVLGAETTAAGPHGNIRSLAGPTKHVGDVAAVALAFDMHVRSSFLDGHRAQLEICLPEPVQQARMRDPPTVKQRVRRRLCLRGACLLR